MKQLKTVAFVFSAILLIPFRVLADEEFHGVIEKRPEGKAGVWVVGGREVIATDMTRLEEDDGPLAAGKCVEVEYERGQVKKIESESSSECE
jgi:hypothetical protein